MDMARPGVAMDEAPHIPELDYADLPRVISADRYASPDFARREREMLWMRVWQIAGRGDDIPEPGDWMVHEIFDQSYVLVRQKDGGVKGFVNACRHRGNAFCEGHGHSPRFTCPYHNWTYALDGQCLSVAKPDYDGTVEDFVGDKAELGLIEVLAEEFAGFIFMNSDRAAKPLAEFMGPAGPLLAAYRLDAMIPYGLNVREPIAANWKAALDAFLESYHVQGIHPELMEFTDLRRERCGLFGWHAATTVPFGAPGQTDAGGAQGVAIVRGLPAANFPGLAEVLPRFEELVASYGGAVPENVAGRELLQRATRESMSERGADVAGLTDNQMSDYQFWLMFPNVYMQLRAGEATVIWFRPDPSGDPNRCFWQVTNLQWFPEGQREGKREPLRIVPEGEHFPYFLALEQDYRQLENQQLGLRNRALKSMHLTRQEPKVAHLHAGVDAWLEGRA